MNQTLGIKDVKSNGPDTGMRAGITVLDQIMQTIQNIRFGEVVVTIHNGRIVQIEKREKTRFQD
ncbi:MAG: YezD family protein [Smithellaceae bacterium]